MATQPQMMAAARAKTSFNVDDLAAIIHGSPETVRGRRDAWARVEAALGASDTSKVPAQYAKTGREDVYLDGLRVGKAAWDDMVAHQHEHFRWVTPRYTLFNLSPFGLSTTLFAKAIELMGTEEQKKKWLVPTLRCEINGAYVQTELGHGSFVRGLETTATFDEARDAWVVHSPTLSSVKFWPGSLGFSATHAVVMARLVTRGVDYGVHPFMVELRDVVTGQALPGIELGDVGPKPSYNENDNGYARFTHVVVPRENMLMGNATVSRDGTYVRSTTVHPKAAYAAMLVTRSKIIGVSGLQLAAAVTIATRYSTVRLQGVSSAPQSGADPDMELPVIQFRHQNHRILTQLSRAYAILFASQHCATVSAQFEERQTRGDFSTMTATHILMAGMKAWATNVAGDGAEDMRKACGGAGFLTTSALPDIASSVTVLCTLEGESYVLWQQVARYLVKHASSPSAPEELSYLSAPYINALPANADLLSPQTHLAIFRHRAQRLIAKAARTIRSVADTPGAAAKAWEDHNPLLISAGRAHVEYLALQSFVSALATLPESLVPILTKLCTLFALTSISTIGPQSGDGSTGFFEDGFLSESQLDDVRASTNRLLDEILPQAIGLTDAWDFTDAGLASALGRKDGDVYETLMSWTRGLPINETGRQGTGVSKEGWEAYVRPALKANSEFYAAK